MSEYSIYLATRLDTQKSLRRFGYVISDSLPLLTTDKVTRSSKEVAQRTMILTACCATAYGFPIEKAWKWLNGNELLSFASPRELLFFNERADPRQFHFLPETIWMFCWILGKVSSIDLGRPCPDNAYTYVPNLKFDEPAREWIRSSNYVSEIEIFRALDFYYCAHWALRGAQLSLKGRVRPSIPFDVVQERRKALEWCFASVNWDDLTLDT